MKRNTKLGGKKRKKRRKKKLNKAKQNKIYLNNCEEIESNPEE